MSLFRLAAHPARQSQTTTPSFSGFFESGMGLTFLEIEAEKEAHWTRVSRARRLRFTLVTEIF